MHQTVCPPTYPTVLSAHAQVVSASLAHGPKIACMRRACGKSPGPARSLPSIQQIGHLSPEILLCDWPNDRMVAHPPRFRTNEHTARPKSRIRVRYMARPEMLRKDARIIGKIVHNDSRFFAHKSTSSIARTSAIEIYYPLRTKQ